MFRQLRGEMIKSGYTISELAEKVGVSEKTLKNKISGRTSFLWSEAIGIRKIVAPEMPLEKLFKEEM